MHTDLDLAFDLAVGCTFNLRDGKCIHPFTSLANLLQHASKKIFPNNQTYVPCLIYFYKPKRELNFCELFLICEDIFTCTLGRKKAFMF